MGRQAAQIGARLQQEIAHVCKMLILEIDRELRRSTPIDTGHARRNWIPSVAVRAQSVATSDAERQAGLQQVLAYSLSQGALWVANVVPYIQRLNYGHSQQAPAGFVEASVDRAMSTVRQKLSGKRGSFIDIAPLQAEFRNEVGGEMASNLDSAYSPV